METLPEEPSGEGPGPGFLAAIVIGLLSLVGIGYAVKHRKNPTPVPSSAGKYISEEIRTGKYPHKQAVAIGISRARQEG